jgi:nucleoside-diphosphate-sugar epimerase
MSAFSPRYLLLGGGYVLSRLAGVLGAENVVTSHLSKLKVDNDIRKGLVSECVDLSSLSAVSKVFKKYPTLCYFVDSVPPLAIAPVAGPRNVVEATSGTGVLAGIYLSTTGVYGEQNGAWVDESCALNPYNQRGRNRVASERVYLEASIPVLSLRLSGIYGPGRGVIESIRGGHYRLVPGRYSNRVHVDDIVAALRWFLQESDPTTWPVAMNLSDDEPECVERVAEYYCKHLSLPMPTILDEEPSAESFFSSNQRVSNKLFHDFTGLKLKYPSYRTVVDGA